MQRKERKKENKKRCFAVEFLRQQRVRYINLILLLASAVLTSIQIIRLLSHARQALGSYEKVDANYRTFRHSILYGFKLSNAINLSSGPSKFLGVDGLIHFSKKVKENLNNIKKIGGFSPEEMIARSSDIANQIIMLNYMMKDRTVQSCTDSRVQL